MADTSMEVVFGISFLTLSNADVSFLDRELTWRTYSTARVLPITKKIHIINQKEFAKALLDPDKKTFMVHIATTTSGITIYLERKTQIA